MITEKPKNNWNGFTLIETLVVMTLFLFVVALSIGVMMQVLTVNQKVRSESSVMNNINTGLETMTIELRYGSDYDCDAPEGCDSITFTNYDYTQVEYFLEDGQIRRSVNGGDSRRLSTPEATISNLRFYVHDDLLVTVVLKGEVGSGQKSSDFSLQTAVSQRQRHEDF